MKTLTWGKSRWVLLLPFILMAGLTNCGDDFFPQQFIYRVTAVDLVTANDGKGLTVQAQGEVRTGGWSHPRLKPQHYETPPADGIYAFDFVASAPGDNENVIDAIQQVDANYHYDELPDNFKGAIVYAETNSITTVSDNTPSPQPVAQAISEVTEVKLSLLNSKAQIQIDATGNVPTTGWSNPVLVAYQYIQAPADGIYDYTFYATPPTDVVLQVVTPISTHQIINAVPTGFKGVRVHSANNEIVALLDPTVPPPKPQAINSVDAISLTVEQANPAKLIIGVKGSVSSSGWSGDFLEPSLNSPKDGIYEFTYYATPPSDPALTVITPTSVTHKLDPLPSDLTGVRVLSANNAVEAFLPVKPSPTRELVAKVTYLQLGRTSTQPAGLELIATGEVNSAGWSGAELVPYNYLLPPSDGIYDFSFFAVPPNSPAADVISTISARYSYPTIPTDIKGFRVHSASNSMLIMIDPVNSASTPVWSVDLVKVFPTVKDTTQFNIYVLGKVNSGGWSNPQLVPFQYIQPPPDGIYDYNFVAVPPSGPSAGAFGNIELVNLLGAIPAEMKGVRIHAATSNIEYVFTRDSTLSACDFISGNRFETADRFDGPPTTNFGSVTGFFWSLSFDASGGFEHHYSDIVETGSYLCDNTGFHMLDISGQPYHGVSASVDPSLESVNLPETTADRFYYRVVTNPLP